MPSRFNVKTMDDAFAIRLVEAILDGSLDNQKDGESYHHLIQTFSIAIPNFGEQTWANLKTVLKTQIKDKSPEEISQIVKPILTAFNTEYASKHFIPSEQTSLLMTVLKDKFTLKKYRNTFDKEFGGDTPIFKYNMTKTVPSLAYALNINLKILGIRFNVNTNNNPILFAFTPTKSRCLFSSKLFDPNPIKTQKRQISSDETYNKKTSVSAPLLRENKMGSKNAVLAQPAIEPQIDNEETKKEFLLLLDTIKTKQDYLKKYPIAHSALEDLITNLTKAATSFYAKKNSNLQDIQNFKTACNEAIETAKKPLKKHRKILGAVFALIHNFFIALKLRLSGQGSYTKFFDTRTNSIKHLDELENKISTYLSKKS